MMGFGAVVPDADEPLFHAEWERRAFGLTMAMLVTGAFSLDAARHARESLHPAAYLGSRYYEIWARALENLAVELGLATHEELCTGAVLSPAAALPRTGGREQALALIERGAPYDRPARTPARFAPGERVLTRNMHPRGHTRLPGYARARRGVVERVRGVFVLPDTNAHGRGEDPEGLTVCFSGRELWGDDADPTLTVSIAAWERYLQPDPTPPP